MEGSFLDQLAELGWGLEVFIVVTATLVVRYVSMRLLKVLGRHLSKTANVWDDALLEAAYKPLSYFILIFGIAWVIEISDGYFQTELFSPDNLDLGRQLAFIVLIAVFLIKFISLSESRILIKLRSKDSLGQTSLDPTTLLALAKLLRLSIVISAVLVALPTVGIEITALLAFGGVGGLAVGFAAQDLLSNFFGGLMIYLDRPFTIGDWIRSPDREIDLPDSS